MNIFKKIKSIFCNFFNKIKKIVNDKKNKKDNNDKTEVKDKNDFRHFIYLDLNFLESFIAQKYKGFPQNFQTEKINERVQNNIGRKATTEAVIESKLDSKIADLFRGKFGSDATNSLNGKFNTKIDWGRNDSSITESKKSIISKTLQDYMYEEFYEYIKCKVSTSNDVSIGDYVEIKNEFYYIDFDRLKKLYSEPFEALHSKEKFGVIKDKIDLLSELIPFDSLLYNSEFIVLIDKDWLKAKKEHIGYTFDGKINVLGRVGKFIEADNESGKPELIKTLDQIQKYAISLLYELGFIEAKKTYLVNPIAIYY